MRDIYRQDAALRRIRKFLANYPAYDKFNCRHFLADFEEFSGISTDDETVIYEYFTCKEISPEDPFSGIEIFFMGVNWSTNDLPTPAIARELAHLGEFSLIIRTECKFDHIVGHEVEISNVHQCFVECHDLILHSSDVTVVGNVNSIRSSESRIHCSGEIGRFDDEGNNTITGNPKLIRGFGRECQLFSRIGRIYTNFERPVFAPGTVIDECDEQNYDENCLYQRLCIRWSILSETNIDCRIRMKIILNSARVRNLWITLPDSRCQFEHSGWLPRHWFKQNDIVIVPIHRIFIDWHARYARYNFKDFPDTTMMQSPVGFLHENLMTPTEHQNFRETFSTCDEMLNRSLPPPLKQMVIDYIML